MINKKSKYMPDAVKHTVRTVGSLMAHSFHPEHIDSVREHIESSGFKQVGPSDVYGPATETTYTHPETKERAILGKNKRSAWLDIEK